MRKDRVAVIGDKDSILAFKAVGIDVFPIYNIEEARDTLRKVARSHKLIFITEDIGEKISDVVNRYNSVAYPIVIPIPNSGGATGYGMNRIRKNVEKAIGVDILFNREEK